MVLTFSSRSLNPPFALFSAARLRGPYLRVSCRPRLLAVSRIEADLDAVAGTMRWDGS